MKTRRETRRCIQYLLLSMLLVGCDYYSYGQPMLEFGEAGGTTGAFSDIGAVQLEEYLSKGKVSSFLKLRVECYKTYSVFSMKRGEVANIIAQPGCDDVRLERYIHKIFLPTDIAVNQEVVEIVCESTSYTNADLEDMVSEVLWIDNKPVCPRTHPDEWITTTYRRYSYKVPSELRPDFEKWEDKS